MRLLAESERMLLASQERRELNGACPPKRRGRPSGPTKSTLEFRAKLAPIIREQKPCTIRQAFYQAVWRNLVDKSENGYGKVQRELLAMRRSGQIPYTWITDLRRQPYGKENWADPDDFIADVASLYRRDYWRNADVRVEFWCEKETLVSAMSPIIVEKWGLDYYAGGGFTSETALFVSGMQSRRMASQLTFTYSRTLTHQVRESSTISPMVQMNARVDSPDSLAMFPCLSISLP